MAHTRSSACRTGSDTEAERDHLRTADVIVGIRLNPSMPRPERLRLYQAPAAGVDQIERDMLPPVATLCNAFGHEDAIAEYVMTALLLRHVPLLDADARLRKGDWRYWAGRPTGLRTELGGSTMGLLGFGHIGKAVGDRAKAFGMRVTVANRTPVPVGSGVDESYGLDDLNTFMGSADAIVVSLPHIPATTGIVGSGELAAMRSDGVHPECRARAGHRRAGPLRRSAERRDRRGHHRHVVSVSL